jgi:hypothetical protein
MVTNDATASLLNGRSDRQEVAVTAVENECESLVCNAEATSGSCDAAAGFLERFANQASFVAKHFSVE